jgi:hypothetical protein
MIVEPGYRYFDLNVSAAGYATLYLDFNAYIPSGVELYTASSVDGNRLMMEQVEYGILPANTGVLVKAEQGTYTFVDTYGTINDQRGRFSDNGAESGLAYTGVCVAVAKVIDQKQTVCYKSLGNGQKPYGHGDVEDGDMRTLEEKGIRNGDESEEEKDEDVSHGNAREQSGIEKAEYHTGNTHKYTLHSSPCYKGKARKACKQGDNADAFAHGR